MCFGDFLMFSGFLVRMYRYLLGAVARSLSQSVEAPRAVYAAWCLGAGAGSLSLAVEAPGAVGDVGVGVGVVIVGTIVATLLGLVVVRRLVLPLGLAVAIVIGGAVGAPEALVEMTIAAAYL